MFIFFIKCLFLETITAHIVTFDLFFAYFSPIMINILVIMCTLYKCISKQRFLLKNIKLEIAQKKIVEKC